MGVVKVAWHIFIYIFGFQSYYFVIGAARYVKFRVSIDTGE